MLKSSMHWKMEELLQYILHSDLLRDASTYVKSLPPREARYSERDLRLQAGTVQALKSAGIRRLYVHQGDALDAFFKGANPLVVTPTASGKSLVYQAAILEELQRDPETRALLIFPLKALEQDQYQRLVGLLAAAGLANQAAAGILDGDTPQDQRRKMRANPPNVIFTNPDMLHYSVLANHRGWSSFFRKLKFIVVDELHIYRGIFGSHVLQVLRRLGRICRFYGSSPRWIAGSATIGNPLELAQDLTSESFRLIERNGAPASGRHFLLVNPAVSPYSLIARLLPEIINRSYKAIVFTKSRRATEMLHRILTDGHPELRNQVSGYRAGFLPEERREIENRLLTDQLSAVISTSALELGMDIGGIDVCILLGYPGTISTLMQRAGRAGRRERDSLIILVAGEDALDQYFMRHPEELFLRPSEAAVVDAANGDILNSHLVCAAAEIPLAEKEPYINDRVREAIETLVSGGKLIPGAGGRRWFPGIPKPHQKVNIRSIGVSYSIHDVETGKQIGDIGESRLWSECHPEAIYLHRGQQYFIERIDDAGRVVYARATELDYTTYPLSEKETEILARKQEITFGCSRAFEGELKVTERITGYQKRRLYSGELISTHELNGPPLVLTTRGIWLEMNDDLQVALEERQRNYMGSLHAVEHALISVFPLEVMCDRGDVGGISFVHHPQVDGAAIFIYDAYPGGLGITLRAYRRLERLINRTFSLVRECPCDDGCPSCVHSPQCGSGNRPLDKEGALFVLEHLLEEMSETRGKTPRTVRTPSPAPTAMPLAQQKKPLKRTLPRAYRNRSIVVFDLETQRGPNEVGGWGNTHLMGLSLAVLQDLRDGAMRTYREEEVDDLLDALTRADLVVGFNCTRFDFGVLSGYTGTDFSRLKVLDLLLEIRRLTGKGASLDALAQANLGKGKSSSGEQALEFYREKRWDALEAYCKEDVRLTSDLFFYLLENDVIHIPENDASVTAFPINLDLGKWL